MYYSNFLLSHLNILTVFYFSLKHWPELWNGTSFIAFLLFSSTLWFLGYLHIHHFLKYHQEDETNLNCLETSVAKLAEKSLTKELREMLLGISGCSNNDVFFKYILASKIIVLQKVTPCSHVDKYVAAFMLNNYEGRTWRNWDHAVQPTLLLFSEYTMPRPTPEYSP